jgi:hypothetical protein
MLTKLTDKVAVHPRLGTIHEVRKGTKMLYCGNPFGLIDYQIMTRKRAQNMSGTKLCRSQACVKARRA